MKKLCLLAAMVLLLTMIPFSTAVSAAAPSIKLDRTVYEPSQTITVTYSGTDTNDWVGIYPYGTVPGGINSLVWQYSVGSGTVTFDVSSLNGAGDYRACLCDNNGYAILDVAEFTVRDGDPTDYGVTSASVQASVTSGKSEIDVTITPSSSASLTYRLYWAANGVRLNDYLYIKEFTHSGASPFTVSLNDCLIMPDAADSIEVAVVNGRSTSYFTAAPQKLKAPTSKKLYEFQVVSDIHLTTSVQAHVPNFKAAMTDIATLSPNSNGIFFVGDNTDRGTQEHYDLLAQTLAEVETTVDLPSLYFAMGNHDQVYGGTYDEELARFIANLKMPGLYYTVDMNGSRFIILGSEKQTTAGDIGSAQLDWFEAQLAATDPSMPVFVFLHQSLRDTVSGSLTSMGQAWYGVPEATARMRSILKNYPNAFLFTGHTHWSFEMTQPFLYGNGEDANFMNTASVAYLYSDDNQDLPGSEGLYIEVYEDYILIRGREFTQSKWCAAAQFLIPRNTSASAGDLVSDEMADWTFDGSVMKVESTDYATVFSNTNDLWPSADYVYDTPITVDPDAAAIYYDFVLENDARTNIYVTFGKTDVSLAPFIPGVTYDSGSGDIIGDGTRIRGSIPMSALTLDNNNGTLTATRTRVYASGAANAKLYIYDLSLISDSAAKTISLMNPDTLAVVDPSLRGGYTYRNGSLTVNADSASGYRVQFLLDETYDVAALKNLLVSANATTAFDIDITASTSKGDTTFSIADNFWPAFCDGKVQGGLPANNYNVAVDWYSCYTFNGLAPVDGRSTIKAVTIKLSGQGSVTLDALQLSSVTAIDTMPDGFFREQTTPTLMMGDVNDDNTVSTVDARMILGYVLGVGGAFSDAQKAAADYDGNGSLSTTDIRIMLQEIVNA